MNYNLESLIQESSDVLLIEFLEATTHISGICKKYGYNLEGHSPTGIAKFLSHQKPVQKKILISCQQFIEFCMSAEKEGINLRDNNTKLTWWALKQFNLRPHSELFNHLTDEHIVEIYNEDSIQVYRSFNLFQFLSYSVSDIFSHEWWELYRRDNAVFDRMLLLTNQLLDGTLTGIVKTNYPDHWVEEIFSPKKLRAVMRHDFFTPMSYKHKKDNAFISAFNIVQSQSNVVS